jgi:hypothetical protein
MDLPAKDGGVVMMNEQWALSGSEDEHGLVDSSSQGGLGSRGRRLELMNRGLLSL